MARARLTTGSYPSDAPAFSPSGKRVAFERLGVGILTMNPDGSGIHRVTTNPRDSFPTWSPDGSHIAFVRPEGRRWVPYIVSTKGGALKALRKSPPAGRPSWTTAGLLVASGGDVVKVDTTNGHVLKYFSADVDAIWGLNTVSRRQGMRRRPLPALRPLPSDDPAEAEAAADDRERRRARRVRGRRQAHLYAAGGQLFIRSLATGTTTAIPTADAAPDRSAPPAWH